ncbi:helix-turn-helix domain-containing protein [Streptomyces sp. NPDC056930]|uniref:helix-turn-helix domain-containing protein n=1 Tax=Streptomyces sp. NPDC056930 TaxID=3345967 RepID=UPI00362B0AFC
MRSSWATPAHRWMRGPVRVPGTPSAALLWSMPSRPRLPRATGYGLRATGYGRASSPSHTPETCITAAGSIVRTAGLLFRHRNIVPRRVRRIHTITGHDTTNCDDHVELSLALGTLRPLGASLIRWNNADRRPVVRHAQPRPLDVGQRDHGPLLCPVTGVRDAERVSPASPFGLRTTRRYGPVADPDGPVRPQGGARPDCTRFAERPGRSSVTEDECAEGGRVGHRSRAACPYPRAPAGPSPSFGGCCAPQFSSLPDQAHATPMQ